MRTKLILGAAILAAGLVSTMAQNVYSLNVVGYYNVPAASGYTLMANQLNTGGNTINEVLPGAPDDALCLTFANNSYAWNIASGGVWYDYNTAEPSVVTLPPGTGFFYNNPGAAGNVTFVGEVPQGALSLALPAGYSLIGCQTPQSLDIAGNSFPIADDALALYFANNAYQWYIASGGAWYDYNTAEPVTLTPAVGQGFFYNNPGAATAWARNFTVQ